MWPDFAGESDPVPIPLTLSLSVRKVCILLPVLYSIIGSVAIRDPVLFFCPGIRNGKKSGSRIKNPYHISQNLVKIVELKILRFFADPGSGAFLAPDPGWKNPDPGSGIKSRIRNTDHRYFLNFWLFGDPCSDVDCRSGGLLAMTNLFNLPPALLPPAFAHGLGRLHRLSLYSHFASMFLCTAILLPVS